MKPERTELGGRVKAMVFYVMGNKLWEFTTPQAKRYKMILDELQSE